MGCKKCSVEESCPMDAAKVIDGILQIDKDVCNNCGLCVGKCHFDAIEGGQVGYKVYIGGRWGKRTAHGKPLGKIFTDKDKALDVIEKTILLYREQGKTGERLSQTIERLGFENMKLNCFRTICLTESRKSLKQILTFQAGPPVKPDLLYESYSE